MLSYERFEQCIEELTKRGEVFQLTLDPASAFTLLSLLQLALRHPGVRERRAAAAAVGNSIATRLKESICARAPALRELAEAGFDPREDVPS